MIEREDEKVPPSPTRRIPTHADVDVFLKKAEKGRQTTFELKLREEKNKAAIERLKRERTLKNAQQEERSAKGTTESVRQWQRHYKKVFPDFVFYFESVPDEQRVRLLKQITALGAVCILHV